MIEVTNDQRKRFSKDKVYIMAHSGGTAFAIRAVSENLQLFSAYIGVAQITRQAESEKLAYRYMVDRYADEGNKKMVNKSGLRADVLTGKTSLADFLPAGSLSDNVVRAEIASGDGS